MLFLSNYTKTRAAPIYWNLKTISRDCYISKDAGTINIAQMVDDATFTARQVEILMFGDYRKQVKVRLFTDSEATLESIASSKK